MLQSHLLSGQTLNFTIDRTVPNVTPNIEISLIDGELNAIDVIKLSPTEAISLSERLHNLVDAVAEDITNRTYLSNNGETDESADARALGCSIQPRNATDETGGMDRDGENTSSDHRPEETWADKTHSAGDMPTAQQRSDTDGGLLSLHPRAGQLLSGAGLDNNGNHAPAHYNVEIDDSWVATITDEPELSAALMPTKQQIAAAEANLKRRQDEVNDFVSWLRLVPRKPNDALSSRSYFDVTVSCEGNPWDEAVMPIAVDSHPWVRSKAMREVILSAFRQGFQYGINWEESRNEGEL